MRIGAHTTLALMLIGCCVRCGPPDTSRPTDSGPAEQEAAGSALELSFPLPKALVSVVDSLVAVLEAPGRPTITKQLEHSPLGPATLTIGAISPGSGYRLTISGYDHARQHILHGEQDGIAITVGDTLHLTMVLTLLISPTPEDTSGGDASEG